MAGNRDNMIIPFRADMFACEYIRHIKAITRSVGQSHIRKDTMHFLFFFVEVVISNNKFLIGQMFDEGK